MQYAELHLHDIYSELDGTSKPAGYMERAKELGITHLAETNHGTLSGHRAFQRAAKEAGITPILGQEGYFTLDRFDRTTKKNRQEGDLIYNHITLLAQNETGLTNLRTLDSLAWSEGFYFKPRIDLEILEAHAEGLVVLSGCLSGVLAKAIEFGMDDHARKMAGEFKRIFGDRYFVEVMSHNPLETNKGLIGLANEFGFKHVVTSDCHHARKEDLWIQDAMLILQTGPKLNSDFELTKAQRLDFMERYDYMYPERKMTFKNYNLHLNSVEEHLAGLAEHGIGMDAITNTMIVANMVDAESYPYYEGLDLLPKTEEDPAIWMEREVMAGLKAKGLDNPEYVARAKHELGIINGKGFAPYFYIAKDVLDWARSEGIRIGYGRGSGAGSLCCYALSLTGIDPIKYKLNFARFIDPSRPDWPDLDIDIQDTRREEVKAYAHRRFGHVASIATFNFLDGKQAVNDAAKVLGVPKGEVTRALKNLGDGATLDTVKNHSSTKEFISKYPDVIKLADGMRGNLRSVGMHAGGLVVANRPLAEIVPLQSADGKAGNGRVPVVALDMNEIADIGLIKFDFLGLKALTVIDDTLRFIKENRGIEIDLDNIPLDDKTVFASLSAGYTKGVFQCEQQPYTKLLINMGGVGTFDELVASNALVRPGAANASFGAAYIRGKNEGIYEFIHPDTKSFTEDTYGQILYQEQQMALCVELAGMTVEESNKVRKAIGKKKPEELAKWKEPFVDGASKKISRARAEALWTDLEAAGDYSFNLSHAVAYSLTSYQTAWLKEHYPVEFMAATLRNESDKNSRLDYLTEAKRLGIRILLPHVNASEETFSIERIDGEFAIRMGLADIKFISGILAARLISKRPFNSYEELKEVCLTKGSGLSTRVLSSLNAVGAAAFDDNPRTGDERANFFEYLNIPAFDTKHVPATIIAQARDLSEYMEDEAFIVVAMVREIVSKNGWCRIEVVDETGSAGIFTDPNTTIEKGRMYVMLIANNSIVRYISVDDLDSIGGGFRKFLELSSLPDVPPSMYKVVAFASRTTKAGKRMATMVLADENKDMVGVLVWPNDYAKAYTQCKEGQVVDVILKEKDDGALVLDRIL